MVMMQEKTDRSIEREIIGEIWQNNEILENMLFMADELGSRFAGTESEKKAQQYLVQKFKEYGYSNAQAETFTYYGWTRGPVSLEMLEPVSRQFPAIALALSPGGKVKGEVINVGTGSPQEFEALKKKEVEGKIVLCSSATSPLGQRVHRRTKYGYAVEYGATGFIFVNHNPGQLPPTGSLRPAYRMGGEIPGIGVSLETGLLLLRLAKGERIKIQFKDESKLIPNSISANVLADLPGKTGEWIVVGGHYDGHDIAQGAMDNLSATAVIMEVARAFNRWQGMLNRGIRFVAFGCEEIGVTGSTCYVDQHQDELKNIAIVVNLELGGLAQKDGTQHAAFKWCQPPELEKVLKEISAEIKYPMTISKETSAASDHWPFFMQGIPTICMRAEPSSQMLVVGRGWGHTSADTMDKVDSRNLQEGAMVLARILLKLANRKEPIAVHRPIDDVVKSLEDSGMRKELEIQKKWHPSTIR
jgi:Zn-dependent M28 family amino/carboxypeptidase